jgi:hypothetical protein
LLLVVVMRFGSCCNLGILLRKNTDNTSGDFVVDDGFIILSDDVDAEFLWG